MGAGFIVPPANVMASHCTSHRSLLPLCFDQRTRQGFLSSNIQPGIRYCIAIASSRQQGTKAHRLKLALSGNLPRNQ
jgi:hypothetical protein